MFKTLIIIVQIIIYILLYIAGSKNNQPVSKKIFKEKGLWWVITYKAGSVVFKKVMAYMKSKSRERICISRFKELYGTSGQIYYETSRSAQLSLLFLSFIFAQIVIFYVRFDSSSLLFGGSLIAAILFLPDKTLENVCNKRKMSIENHMPEFLSRLAILVDAGLTIKMAMQRIVKDSKESDLYSEIKVLIRNLDVGRGENFSFEEFARRCNTPTGTSFAALVLQNIKKGNKELSAILRIFASSCWNNRKNNARKRGEEAAAKLMLPMMIIFIAIMILMAAPAFFKLNL